jgi:hypothetical protein
LIVANHNAIQIELYNISQRKAAPFRNALIVALCANLVPLTLSAIAARSPIPKEHALM